MTLQSLYEACKTPTWLSWWLSYLTLKTLYRLDAGGNSNNLSWYSGFTSVWWKSMCLCSVISLGSAIVCWRSSSPLLILASIPDKWTSAVGSGHRRWALSALGSVGLCTLCLNAIRWIRCLQGVSGLYWMLCRLQCHLSCSCSNLRSVLI